MFIGTYYRKIILTIIQRYGIQLFLFESYIVIVIFYNLTFLYYNKREIIRIFLIFSAAKDQPKYCYPGTLRID